MHFWGTEGGLGTSLEIMTLVNQEDSLPKQDEVNNQKEEGRDIN